MIHAAGLALLGLLAGLSVRALLPGHPAVDLVTAAILGLAGGWLAAFAGEKLGLYRPRDKAGFLMSVVGAMALLLIYSLAR